MSQLPLSNKFTALKAAMTSNNNAMWDRQPVEADSKIRETRNQTTTDVTSDGLKMVSHFETEQEAIQYATELQKYYDGLNMDVKVSIEMNLEDLDDTAGKTYLQEALKAYEVEQQNDTETKRADLDKKRIA